MTNEYLTPEQWRQAWEIFQAARDQPAADRDSLIATRTADPAVAARVAALLAEGTAEEEPVKPRERTPGERVGRYVLDERIGRGGYGEVWSGHDLELGRRVALKFMTGTGQQFEQAARRVQREARAVSALNHPHIVVVHEVVSSESGPVIVMELVDGVPLRSFTGALLPPAKAAAMASQILKALAFAHAAGVVHRDLKPENVMVRPDGFLKVLDFGLARQAVEDAGSLTASAGLGLGTLRYMAPEQCRGEAATPKSDVFAAAVILYELLAGRHPFESGSWIETVHTIVNREAKPLPGPYQALLARMLSKSPDGRPTAEEAARALEVAEPVAAPSSVSSWKWWASAAALAVGLFGVAWVAFRSAGPANDGNARLTDTRLDVGEGTIIDEKSFALSPDGRTLVFHGYRPQADGEDGVSLQVLDLARGTGNAVKLSGFPGQHPFWSPDGKELGYIAGGKLWRKPFPDGPAREICDADKASSAHWGSNGIILFASSSYRPISRVAASGGQPRVVTPFEPDAERHEAPALLPDGRHFVYWSAANRRIGKLMLGEVDGREPPKVLAETQSSAIFLPRPGSTLGALVYRARGALMALPFDAVQNRVTGAAKVIAPRTDLINHHIVPATASASGDLIYREALDRRIQVKIFDRRGQLLRKFGEPKEYIAARPSPDFQRFALLSENRVTAQRDFEIFDLRTNQGTPVPEAVGVGDPTWSPDGLTLLAANSAVSLTRTLYRIGVPLAGPPVVKSMAGLEYVSWPSAWAADGKSALLIADHPKNGFDVWMLPMRGTEAPRALIASPAREQRASLSPDGKLILYMSDETKSSEVWVTPNPPDGRKWKISTSGGQEPHWRGDGQEIFYQSADFALMTVKVTGTSESPSFSKPEVLFGGRSAEPALMVWHCEPSADGQRFAILTGALERVAAPLRLRQNWWAEGQ